MNLAAVITVFGWSFLSFWSAIPAGIALGVTPPMVGLVATISYGCGAALVVIVGTPLRERLQRRIEGRSRRNPDGSVNAPKPNRMMRLVQSAWDRFGVVGLAALAPLTVGSLIGAAIGLSLGAKPIRLILALTLGAALWGALILIALSLGLMAIGGGG